MTTRAKETRAKTSRSKDLTEADRYALNQTTEITEALARLGKFDPSELEAMQADRAKVGAKPLRFDDVRVWNASSVAAPEAFTPDDVKKLRKREGASQAIFARHLGVATNTLGQWERGQRKPEGPAAKLLSLVKAHGLQYISR